MRDLFKIVIDGLIDIVKAFFNKIMDKPLQWAIIIAIIILLMSWENTMNLPVIGEVAIGTVVLGILGFGL